MAAPKPTTLMIATELVLRVLGSFERRRLTFFTHPTIVVFPITASISGEDIAIFFRFGQTRGAVQQKNLQVGISDGSSQRLRDDINPA